MRERKDIIDEIIKLINKSDKDSIYFFSKLKDLSFFSPLADAGMFEPFRIPNVIKKDDGIQYVFWSQGEYLALVASAIQTGEIRDASYISRFLKVVRKLYGSTDNPYVVNSIFIGITRIPSVYLVETDINSIFTMVPHRKGRNVLRDSMVHEGFGNILRSTESSSHSRSILAVYLEHLFSAQKSEKGMPEGRLAYFDEYSLKTFQAKHFILDEIAKFKIFILTDSVAIFNRLLEKSVTEKELNEGSHYWRPAIEHHSQNQYHDTASSIYVEMLFTISSFLLSIQKELPTMDEWKDSRKIIFRRIYIALCTDHFEDLANVCGEMILTIEFDRARHEVFRFFERRFDLLSADLQERILDKIDALNAEYYKGNDDKEKNVLIAWQKIRWLQAIKNSKSDRAKEMYNGVLQITGSESEFPDFSTYIGATWVGSVSPWKPDDFARATADEIFEKLRSFENSSDSRAPTVDGLYRAFQDYVFQDPIKCAPLVEKMVHLRREYLSAMYDGYSKAWAEKKYVPVESLLNLALRLNRDPAFRTELSLGNSTVEWVPSSIFQFIETGVRKDAHAFDPKFNGLCFDILRESASIVLPRKEYNISSDSYTRAINEPRGKLFEAAINLALRKARLASMPSGIEKPWSDLLQIIGDPLKSLSSNEISLRALIGANYRQLLFLNDRWLFENIDTIAPTHIESLWVAFMDGFGYVAAYVPEVYKLLKSKGYLLAYLRHNSGSEENNNRRGQLQNRIIELMVAAYLVGDEPISNGLLREVIDAEDQKEWHQLLFAIVAVLGKRNDQEQLVKAKQLIHILLDKSIRNGDLKNWMGHFQGASKLLSIFDDPGESVVKDLINVVASNSQGFWDLSEVIDYLFEFRDSHSNVVGNLFLGAIEITSELPTWPDEKIRGICQSLFDSSEKIVLAKICNIYSLNTPDGGGPIKIFCDKI